MLAPDDRTLLTDILRPPPGAELTHAVATTFTLDLESALTAPLSFAASRMSGCKDPLAIMESLRGSADRLDVFYQAGELQVPGGAVDLAAFLEPMLHPVHLDAGRLFHPKLWLLEFTSDEATTFRLAVLSRNLTQDRSWDVAVQLDGTKASRPFKDNGPLSVFVRSLPELAQLALDESRRARIETLARSVRYARWDYPELVTDLFFHPLGLAGRRKNALDFSGASRYLVVSAFCSDDGLQVVAPDDVPRIEVISRAEQLDRLSPIALERVSTAYVLNDSANHDAEDPAEEVLSGLHAKIYIVERRGTVHLYLGSANATAAGFGGNVEFLVELVGRRSQLGIDSFIGPDAPFAQLLEEYEPAGSDEPDDDLAERALETELRRLSSVALVGQVRHESAAYSITVSTEPGSAPDPRFTATLQLLTRRDQVWPLLADLDIVFTGLDLTEVTPFVVVRVTDARGEQRGSVVQADLRGDDSDHRRNEILARTIDTPEKFLTFLALLLGLAGGQPLTLPQADGTDTGLWFAGSRGLFEGLVRALGAHPGALDDIGSLVEHLRRTERGRQVMPAGFDDLWAVVHKARDELREDA